MSAGAFEHYARRVMSGDARGPRAAAIRAALTVASLPYACAVRFRNRRFDAGLRRPASLPRPVISVGNITTGGTGKTPVVRWLAERLRQSGKSVAILSRGYKAQPGALGDEQQMLASLLNRGDESPVIVRANPSRVTAGNDVLRDHPEVDVFLLDDGFQHRQLARDFDLVLVNAAEPFGFGRVLPRGLLREPLAGLGRADAFLLTRRDTVSDAARAEIRDTLRQHNPTAPVFESVHAHTGFRVPGLGSASLPVGALTGHRWFSFCGIGDPKSFVRQLESLGGTPTGSRAFADHHPYNDADVRALRAEAAAAGADVLVTTEKDWAKLAALASVRETGVPIWRVDVEVRFTGDHESRLLAEIERAIRSARRL